MDTIKTSLGSLIICTVVLGCGDLSTNTPADEFVAIPEVDGFHLPANGIPVGFRGDAIMVIPARGEVEVQVVETELPVMQFFGASSGGDAIAYTTLAAAPTTASEQRRTIDHARAKNMELDELVPTGELVVETSSGTTLLSPPDRFVVDAAWSPKDPGLLAYTYMQGDSYGVTVIEVDSGDSILDARGEYLADHVVWDPAGRGPEVFELGSAADDAATAQPDGESAAVRLLPRHFDLTDIGARRIDADDERRTFGLAATSGHAPFEIRVRDGLTLRGDNLLGTAMVSFGDKAFEVDRIKGWSDDAVVYLDYTDAGVELRVAALDADTNDSLDGAVLTPRAMVNYYLPFAQPTKVYVTQVGAGIGGGCGLYDHTNGSTMAYAVDFQISGAIYDGVVAPAAGTVAGYMKTATANCFDSSGCGIYSANCGCSDACSGYGWGNYVILAHADDTWTKATHLEGGTVPVSATGKSAARGCYLGDEGGTGRTLGSKGGCGDHLHFQRQTSSSRGGTSTSISFTDAAVGSGSCQKIYTATTGGMSCIL